MAFISLFADHKLMAEGKGESNIRYCHNIKYDNQFEVHLAGKHRLTDSFHCLSLQTLPFLTVIN